MGKVVTISQLLEEKPWNWQDSPLMQIIAAKDRERCLKAIEAYEKSQKKKQKAS